MAAAKVIKFRIIRELVISLVTWHATQENAQNYAGQGCESSVGEFAVAGRNNAVVRTGLSNWS